MPRASRLRPPWENDPQLLNVGRRFTVNWLIGDDLTAGCYLYEVYEFGKYGHADSAPAYVGITRNFPARWGEHRRASWWFGFARVQCIVLSGYATRRDALKAEAVLIDEHHPMFNTKPEYAHLTAALHDPPAAPGFTAELLPRRRHRNG